MAAERSAAVRAAVESRPDVIVLDTAMVAALDALRELESVSSAPLVALDVPMTGDSMIGFAEAGVVGYVSRNGSVEDVVEAIRAARSGVVSCEPALAGALVRAVRSFAVPTTPDPVPQPSESPLAALTAREREIARLIVFEGLSNKEIAERLIIELPTVKNHVHNVLVKLGVSRRTQAAASLRERGPVQTV